MIKVEKITHLQTQSFQVMLILKFTHPTAYRKKGFRRNTSPIYTSSTHDITLDDSCFKTLKGIMEFLSFDT